MAECEEALWNAEGCILAKCQREPHEDEWHEASDVMHDIVDGKFLHVDLKWREHRAHKEEEGG